MDTSKPSSAKLNIFLLILGLATVLALSSILMKEAPEPMAVANDTRVKIAFIEIWGNYSNTVKLFEEVIEPEVNMYAVEHGLNITFDFMPVQAGTGGGDSLTKVQELHEAGVRYIIGSNCVACVSYHYIMEHDMVLISPWSPQNLFSIEDEHMFRVCPADHHNAKPIQRVTDSVGVRKAALMLREGNLGDDLYEGFDGAWINETILEEIRYEGSTTEFTKQLNLLNKTISDAYNSGTPLDELGVIALCLAEIESIYNKTAQYPLLREVTWIGYEGTARLDESKWIDSLEGIEQIKLYSPIYSVVDNQRWRDFSSTYMRLTGELPNTDTAYDYDAAWLMALTLMEPSTVDRRIFAEKIPNVASSYEGLTGVIRLDEYGDRVNASYDIWYYVKEGEDIVCKLAGFYDGEKDEVIWFTG